VSDSGAKSHHRPGSLSERHHSIVGSDISVGCCHELIPPTPFPWKGKGEEENKLVLYFCAPRAEGVETKCISNWKAPLFPREGFGVSSWTTTLTNFNLTNVIGSGVSTMNNRRGFFPPIHPAPFTLHQRADSNALNQYVRVQHPQRIEQIQHSQRNERGTHARTGHPPSAGSE
jgi:hypothetical protein